MELKLPMVVVHHSSRQVEAWLPHVPTIHQTGPSLSELRDELALQVMESFERTGADALGRFQLPPHLSLKHVKIDTVARDKKHSRRYLLAGTLGILVEKWPADDFWIATPTRLTAARFAVRNPSDLEASAARAIAAYCLKHRIEDLEAYNVERRERLDILEVDAYLPSILPSAPRPRLRAPRRKHDETKPAETAQEKEERRRRRRLAATTLREVARNLTHAAMDDTLERAFSREGLVRSLVEEFEGREGVAICLVGPSGVGKTAIIHEVTRRLHARYAAAGLRRDVWRVDGNRFIAGMMYVGQWEARARQLIDELVDIQDILYADDLTSLVYAGRTSKGSTNVAQFLEPHLARGELTMIGECTPERFQKLREEAPTFAALFRVVPVPELTDRETLPVLLGALRDLESEESVSTGVRLSPAALEGVLHLTRRFLAHDAFPGKAVRLLKAVVSQGGSGRLDVRDVHAAFQRQTGLPPFILGSERPRTRAQVLSDVGNAVAGQPEAIDAVADVIVSMQHALSDPEKPLGTFLFVGPTGVGKTETAKALARYLFGSAQRLLRFDMSEFNSSLSVTRLVGHAGAPEGELTLALRTQPFCVILFDEVEKAHPRVFDALLQLLGEGRITDATGRTADARQSVIIMTSNLGVREAASRTGFSARDEDESRRHYVSAAQRFFRPEFFNRIDRIVPFRSLGPDALRVVVEHALTDLLGRRGIQSGNVLVDVEPELLDFLVEKAYDPRYGARPLKRALERKLTVPLAHHLVRRHSEDFSRVELYRRGDDLGLTVTALRPAPRIESAADSSRWTTAELARRFRLTQAMLEDLSASDAVNRLKDERARILRDPSAVTSQVGALELLDELSALTADVTDLADGALAETAYEEEGSVRDLTFTRRDSPPRPTQVFAEMPLQVNLEAALKVARAQIVQLHERALILQHQVRAAASGENDVVTVLIEPASSDVQPVMLASVTVSLPSRHLRQHLVDADGTWMQPTMMAGRQAKVRRMLRVYSGPGIKALLRPLMGHALYTSSDMPPRRVLIKVQMLEEGEGVDAVQAYDARALAARDARRRGDDIAMDPVPATLAWDRPADGQLRHIASGLSSRDHDSVLAAILQARQAE